MNIVILITAIIIIIIIIIIILLSSLYRIFTIMTPKHTTALQYVLQQLFCSYSLCYM
jgi:uncharacterized protein YpmB